MALGDVLDAVRRPEYTGEHRCWPCTLVNAAIAVGLAAGLALLAPVSPAGAAALAAAVLVVAAAAIGLRGYLVPGTPRLTRTYLPERVLRYFDHGPSPGAPGAPTDADDVDPVAVLVRAGAVAECEHEDDLCLVDDFRDAWTAGIDRRRAVEPDRADLSRVLDVPAEAVAFEDHDDAFVAYVRGDAVPDGGFDGRRLVGQWESRGAFLADVAGADVLEDRLASWAALDPRARGQVLNGLRVFLEACPTCGGPVTFGEASVASCCRSRQVAAVTCDACGDRLFESPLPASG